MKAEAKIQEVREKGVTRPINARGALREALKSNLEFHEERSNHSTHDFHAFPAKFPPQLPRFFIQQLTLPGESVLDPMAGSGTTLVEAVATGRRAIGFDIDPLSVLMSTVKTTPLDSSVVAKKGHEISAKVEQQLS